MKLKLWLVILFAILSVVTISQSTYAENAYKVGIILPLTGDKADFGEIEKRSFEMAAEEINATDILNGRKIEFIYEDDTGRSDVAEASVKRLLNHDNVIMISGGFGSTETKAMAKVINGLKVPFLITSAADTTITQQGWNYVFRLNPPASEYTTGLESFLKEIAKPKTAVVLYENTGFGSAGAKEFKGMCEKLQINLLLSERYQSGTSDFRPILNKVKQANPDLIYMVSYLADATALIMQSTELKITPRLFVGNGAGFTLPEFQKMCGKNADNVFSSTLWSSSLPYPGAKSYYDKYVQKFKEETEYHGAEAYAAAYVIADVLKRTKSTKSDDILDALSTTDIQTVFGNVKFQSYNNMANQNQLPTYLAQWINGKLELVWPKTTATKHYIYPLTKITD